MAAVGLPACLSCLAWPCKSTEILQRWIAGIVVWAEEIFYCTYVCMYGCLLVYPTGSSAMKGCCWFLRLRSVIHLQPHCGQQPTTGYSSLLWFPLFVIQPTKEQRKDWLTDWLAIAVLQLILLHRTMTPFCFLKRGTRGVKYLLQTTWENFNDGVIKRKGMKKNNNTTLMKDAY